MSNRGNSRYEAGRELLHQAYKHQANPSRFNQLRMRAVTEFRAAAYAGHKDAQFELGLQYEEFGALNHNPRRAFYWYLKAARQDHANACNSVGAAYDGGERYGYGVPRNPSEAIRWFKRGAELGDSLAKENLKLALREQRQSGARKS